MENGKYLMIPVRPETYRALADELPKSWTWDEAIHQLTQMWIQHRGKVIRTGKSTEDNQTS